MSYSNLLTHRCDIYHLKKKNSYDGGSFGIPTNDLQEEYYYEDQADLTDASCYFSEKNQSIFQGEPENSVIQSFLVHFLSSIDVRTNDKVIWNGVEFKLQIPKKIKNHHIEVTAIRSGNL
ncbi:DUF3599 family protein [Heyndrickxia sp. NPDC080065]|uniref:DUF3599 family protein n=1 Tax=Heyndrickxia sp. NPDC080065 TaxID=3390568 RepID=UPI003CFD638A